VLSATWIALAAISQMTVSQMDALSMSESHHQRMHWLSEQILNWSGLADHSASGASYLPASPSPPGSWLPDYRGHAGPAADATRSIASIQARGLVGYGAISRSQPDPFGKIEIIIPNGRG
jgi:hypothetical protein